MKKLVLILVLVLTAFAGYSQPGLKDDTCICVTPQEIREANMTYDSLRIMQKENAQQQVTISDLKALTHISDSVIKKQDQIHLNDLGKINNLSSRNDLLTRANLLLVDQNTVLKSDKKRLRKKLGWITGLGVTVISGLIYLQVK